MNMFFGCDIPNYSTDDSMDKYLMAISSTSLMDTPNEFHTMNTEGLVLLTETDAVD